VDEDRFADYDDDELCETIWTSCLQSGRLSQAELATLHRRLHTPDLREAFIAWARAGFFPLTDEPRGTPLS